MKQNVTMQDIADRFGVSKVTVSKALNDKEGVSPDLKKKIQDVAGEMGYRFNTIARALKENQTYNIGVIIAERYTDGDSRTFYMSFYQHLSKVLDGNHYSAIMHILPLHDEKELKLPRIYSDNKIDGFVVLGQIRKAYVDLLISVDIPVIYLDFYDEHSDMDSIITDNFYGSYEITNLLFQHGHQDIAFVGNIYSTSSIQDRYLGYFKSLLEHGKKLRDDWLIFDRDDDGVFIPLKLPEDKPTAFVCNCDQVAHYLVKQLNLEGYKVPDDFSVVGFDNDLFATITDPQITTVEVNVIEMAKDAVECLLEKIADPSVRFGRISVKGSIVNRQSVKRI